MVCLLTLGKKEPDGEAGDQQRGLLPEEVGDKVHEREEREEGGRGGGGGGRAVGKEYGAMIDADQGT